MPHMYMLKTTRMSNLNENTLYFYQCNKLGHENLGGRRVLKVFTQTQARTCTVHSRRAEEL